MFSGQNNWPRQHGSALVPSLLKFAAAAACLLLCSAPLEAAPRYAWVYPAQSATLESRFSPPAGFERVPVEAGSFAEWLRGLPMKPSGAAVLLHTGSEKWRQDVHAGVVDIDTGKRDLQQCADAVMRLRAEWLYSLGRKADIAFNDTEGKRLRFSARAQQDYPGLRKYLDYVFAYAGTYSLERELVAADANEIQGGDVFIKGGFPGHSVWLRMSCQSSHGREALSPDAKLHAGAEHPRLKEPGGSGRLALVSGRVRQHAHHAGMAILQGPT